MSKWSNYYKNRVGESYPEYCKQRYAPMLEELAKSGATFREEGCGIGTISKILLRDRNIYRIDLCDKDFDILQLASQNIIDPRATFDVRDARYQPQEGSDCIFGHGVLEHFEDSEIEMILERQKAFAGKVVHYVPTDGYESASFGDERLLPWSYWCDLWKPTRFQTFNEGKDLLLVWE